MARNLPWKTHQIHSPFVDPGMGDLRIYPVFRIFFSFVEKKPEPGKLTIFLSGKKWGYDGHYCRPATHPDLIRISRLFSTNPEVSQFPYSTFENPIFVFCLTKRCLTLSHVPCLQAYKVWAKNKFYDRLN